MRFSWKGYLAIFAVVCLVAIGANPRYIEELVIGGGPGDDSDGGLQFEKDGVATWGDGTYTGELSPPTFTGNRTWALPNASGTLSPLGTAIDVAEINATGTPGTGTYLRGDGSWTTPPGSGDVVGPSSVTDGVIVRFDGTTGKLIKAGTTINLATEVTGQLADANVSNTLTASKFIMGDSTTDDVDVAEINATGTPDATKYLRGDGSWVSPPGSGDVSGPGSVTDDTIAVWDGAAGTLLKEGIDKDNIVSLTGSQSLTNKTVTDVATNNVRARGVGIAVYNDSGGEITIGTPVYFSGYDAGTGYPEISKADNDGTGTWPAVGIVPATISNAASGQVFFSGVITGIDTSSYTVGELLYLDSTAGALTDTKPTASGEAVQPIAQVSKVDASTGAIIVQSSGQFVDIPAVASILGDWDNTTVPWADNEVSDTLTASKFVMASGSTTDSVDIGELNTTGTPNTLKYLRGDFQWVTPAGGGDVTSGGASDDNELVRFDGTSGTAIQPFTSNKPTATDDGAFTFKNTLTLDDSALAITEGVDTLTISVPALTAARAVTFPDAAGEATLLGQAIDENEMDFSGTPDADTYARGDGAWATPPTFINLMAAAGKPTTSNGSSEPSADANDNWSISMDTGEYAFWEVILPSNFDGTVDTINIHWFQSTSVVAVTWKIQAVTLAAEDAMSTAWSTDTSATAQTASDVDEETITSVTDSDMLGTSASGLRLAKIRIGCTYTGGGVVKFSGCYIEL